MTLGRGSDNAALARRLGLADAVVLGLGSMLGAGVFSAFGPAARSAGTGLLIGLVIAIVIAYCNATASAQLAAVYPVSGGTYVYGREQLGPWWGFIAGWGFVVGKTASCAAMAITFAAYVVPGSSAGQRVVAVAVVVALTSLTYRGITRTAQLTRLLVAVTVAVLLLVVAGIVLRGGARASNLHDWTGADHASWYGAVYGVLQSAALLFFALAGYARIATLGEEVRDPARTIPRAIVAALSIAAALYAAVALAALAAAGPDALAHSSAPLRTAVEVGGAGGLASVVRVGAAAASLGALLALLAGVGRTTLAMSRERDLPAWLDAVHPRYHVPHRAELALGGLVCVVVAVADLRSVIGFSSFGVLVYYAIANCSAYSQPAAQRRWPRWLNGFGAAGCLVLVAALPWTAVATGSAVFAIGIVGRMLLHRRRPGRDRPAAP